MLTTDIEILGIPIGCMDRDQALSEIVKLYERPEPAQVSYVNAHSLNLATKDPEYRDVLLRSDLVLNDGAGVGLAARIHGRRFPENLNGSDLNPEIVALASERGWPVYLLGGRPQIAERASDVLKQRFPALQVAGAADGYFSDPSVTTEKIRASGAGLLMVAMGNPLQELFLARHLTASGASVGIGVGAFFDFTAGVVPRAPAWMNTVGIEWVYRLKQEPKRMWKRYVVGNPLFLVRVLSERLRRKEAVSRS